MSKTLKMSILLIVITLGFLFLGTEVKAVYIEPTTIAEAFNGKNVTINGTTITLNSDVEFTTGEGEEIGYDMVEIFDGDFVLNLNGHTLKAWDIGIDTGKLTIEDSTGKGKIDAKSLVVGEEGILIINNGIFQTDMKERNEEDGILYYLDTSIINSGETIINDGNIEGCLETNGKATINNGTIGTITNGGNLTINNAKVSSIMNTGKIRIEDGAFGGISQDGEAVINGGVFTAHKEFGKQYDEDEGGYAQRVAFLNIDTTIINGGEFKNNDYEYALTLYINKSEYKFKADSINEILGENSVVEYEVYGEPSEWDVCYNYVKVTEQFSDVFKKILKDGVLELSALKPSNIDDSDFLLTSAVKQLIKGTGYEVQAYCYVEEFDENGDPIDYNPERVCIRIYKPEDYENTLEEHIVKAKYLDITTETAKTVNSVLSKMKYYENHSDITIANSYRVDDLYLINYLFASAKNEINTDQALNFSSELIKATNGANISFEFEARNGGANPEYLYRHCSGQVIVYHDGEAYTSRNAGLTTSHVLYIPDTTADNDEAYIAAALKRIKDYMGEDTKIKITLGGKLDDISDTIETYNKHKLFDDTKTMDNYYVVTINEKEYNFAICKKEANKLDTPKYIGSNLGTNITITTDSTEVPLDTAVTVKNVEDKKIEKALGTDVYAAYDISLFSSAKNDKIEKIGGKFKVTIPVPESLKNIPDLTVYYIDDEGKKTDKEAKVDENGIATFETNHFSTYVLAEKVCGLIFDTNEGKFPNGKTKIEFEDVTKFKTTDIENPVRDGYTFKGWFTEKTGGISFDTVMNGEAGIQKTTTFYAQWEENSAGEPGIPEGGEQEGENNNTGNTNTENTNTNVNNNTATGENPKTGDNIVLFTVISIVAVVGIMVAIKVKKYVKE